MKTDPGLGLTPYQETAYVRCFGSSGDRNVCFLVPQNWKHVSVLVEVKARAAKVGVDVRSCEWPELVQRLQTDSAELNDQVVREAIDFNGNGALT